MYSYQGFKTMCSNRFCLCEPYCTEWDCCSKMSEDSYEDQEPPKKVPRTEPAGRTGQQHFGTLKSNTEMIEICKGFVPDNTKKNTEWAIRVFSEWRSYRNKATTVAEEMCPVDWLERQKHHF